MKRSESHLATKKKVTSQTGTGGHGKEDRPCTTEGLVRDSDLGKKNRSPHQRERINWKQQS